MSKTRTNNVELISKIQVLGPFILAVLPMLVMAAYGSPMNKDVEPPKEWAHLAYGARFRDLVLPAPIHNNGLTTNAWGAASVLPRDVENSIEDPEWSYWGGRPILGPNGKYHMFVARWREDNPKGHAGWPGSEIVRAVSDSPLGPFKVAEVLGKGHFPEIHKMPDGKYWCFYFHGAYIADHLEGPWEHKTNKELGFNTTFGSLALREDGSALMIDRSLHMWLKEKGSSEFEMISKKFIEPKRIHAAMGYEDPMIWRDEVQYHLLVNDWYGRVAYHMRSKDGVHWKEDPGEAFGVGIDRYEDGTTVNWYKYERPKVLQDKYGRATHLYLAVIDVPKNDDKSRDKHSSKNIALPLVVERRLSILNEKKIDRNTKIRLLIRAEQGFNPQTDVDVASLRFGAPEVVDYGRGCKPIGSEKQGDDLVVTFEAFGHGLNDDNFAAKLLGRTVKGKLIFGYSRLPGVDYSLYTIKKNSADAGGE